MAGVDPKMDPNNNQILYDDQTTREENFYMVDYECWRAICLRQLIFFSQLFQCRTQQ